MATVSTYAMKALSGNGKHVGMYPVVALDCGCQIKFMERMSKREALRQAEQAHERRGHDYWSGAR